MMDCLGLGEVVGKASGKCGEESLILPYISCSSIGSILSSSLSEVSESDE